MGWIQYIDRRPEQGDRWIPCDYCGGGTIDTRRENQPTDRGWLGTETPSMAYRGYRITNECPHCRGEGGTFMPRSTTKNRLNVAYDPSGQWIKGTLQTWRPEHGGWHPALTSIDREKYRWKFASDTDPEQWEEGAE